MNAARRCLRVPFIALALVAFLALGQIVAVYTALADDPAAIDDETRQQHALPAAWPLYVAILLVAACAASALWPWGFA